MTRKKQPTLLILVALASVLLLAQSVLAACSSSTSDASTAQATSTPTEMPPTPTASPTPRPALPPTPPSPPTAVPTEATPTPAATPTATPTEAPPPTTIPAATAAATVLLGTPPPNEEASVGAYTLRVWSPINNVPDRLKNGYYGTGTISNARDEWIVDDATHLLPLPAADITGDGQPETMFAVQAGGSHCCSGIALYSLGDAPKLLLRAMGGGGLDVVISDVRDLDGDGVYELVGRQFVPVECSWPSAQLILAYDGQGYVQAGQRFASEYGAEIAQLTAAAEAGLSEAATGYKCGGVLDLTLAYLYSGQADRAWAEFYRLYPAPDAEEFRGWIKQAVAGVEFPPRGG